MINRLKKQPELLFSDCGIGPVCFSKPPRLVPLSDKDRSYHGVAVTLLLFPAWET